MKRVGVTRVVAGPPAAARCICLSAVILSVAAAARAQQASGAPYRGSTAAFDSPNGEGVLRTITMDGSPLDDRGPFFQSLGTNGRSCSSCHVPSTGWTLSPQELRDRFERSKGLDPVFRPVDGANSPKADVSTLTARRAAYSMLLDRGVLRIGLPIPANAEFDLVKVDDPYKFASASELSLFRRPPPSTNLRFVTAVMWDGRESSSATGTTPIRPSATPEHNADALIDDLMDQANGAVTGHAQGAPLSQDLRAAIAMFELDLVTAQRTDRFAGQLNADGALGGPENLAAQPFYVTINDALGADVQTGRFDPQSMTLFRAWTSSHAPDRAAIARGAALFGSPRINIPGVAGLNDELGIQTMRGSCTTCHDAPNVGGHSVALPVDLGITDASRRAPEMPLYTLRNRATGQTRQTTDPGLALITGRWKDIGKFKGPLLRGLASRAPYFHDGSAADLRAVVEFYDERFNIGFTDQEKSDLVAFLSAL